MSFDFVSPRVHPPPYSRLYRHALESIFSQLTLSELGRVSSTCRDWSAAVDSMQPIGACIALRLAALRTISNSRLMRQVAGIRISIGTTCCASELATVLCDITKRSKSLTTMDFSKGWACHTHAAAIAEAIKQSKSLASVNLSYTSIGDEGAVALAEAIAQSKSLTSVDLGDNRIGNEGAVALAEAIKQNTSLTSLDLRCSRLGDTDKSALILAAKQSTSRVTVIL